MAGIDWDSGPYFQTKRLEIYQEYIQHLLENGSAYYCTCSPEELEVMRQKGMAAGGKPKYDGTCREKGLSKTKNAVVRFKAPLTGTTVLMDVVKGNIVFQNSELDDFIIARGDGMPTYNFCVVVDDITMGINTIIRGDDHVMNTPKQIQLYRALGSPLPTFGHVPMVLGNDRTRLSKRHGAVSVTAYRDMGYLPEALINYLVRLGWSYGDQEFFTREELIEKFTLENIGHSPGVFDLDKLQALNADHIKATPPARLAPVLMPFLKAQNYSILNESYVEDVIGTLRERSKTLLEMAESARFYFEDAVRYDEEAAQKFLKPPVLEAVTLLIDRLSLLNVFEQKALEDAFLEVMNKTGLKLGKIAQPVRLL